jgi:hypothetical protein
MFVDKSFFPSFIRTLLVGVEWDLVMLECLVIAAMDRATYLKNNIVSGLVLGVLIAYLIDNSFIMIRNYRGRGQIALRTLVNE